MIAHPKRVTLLDFDGVLYKNPKASWYIAKRSAEFVRKVMKVPQQQSENINMSLYQTYGHTVLGLQKLGYPVTLQDFDDFIYDNMPYTVFRDATIPELPPSTYVFSNAPSEYIDKIAQKKMPNIRDLNLLNVKEPLKPKKWVYEQLTSVFPDHQIFFVDDSMINFTHSMDMPNWVNVLYVDGSPIKPLSNNLMVAGTIKMTDIASPFS
jgi:hypothetical protein